MARYCLDTRGLKCPLPVLKTEQRIDQLAPGDELEVLASDPVSVIDIPHFCQSNGHVLLDSRENQESFVFVIQVGHTSALAQ